MPSLSIYFKKYFAWLIICLIFVGIGYWIYRIVHVPQKKKITNTITEVTLAPVTLHKLPFTITTYATTVSPKSVTLQSQTPGIITKITFKPGQRVKAGQVLFTLLSNDISNQAKKLYAAMLSSKSYYERQKRANELVPGTVSKYDVQKAKLQYEQDLAAYKESHTINQVRAPINGIISDTELAVGSYVDLGQTLAHLVDPHSLQVKYQLPSQYLHQVKLGQQIQFVLSQSHQSFIGHVSYIAPLLDKNDYNLTLRADFNSVATLKPHQFGELIQTLNPNQNTLAVPQAYAQADAQGFYVLIVDHNKVTKRYFSAGTLHKNGFITIESGLTPNTKVISSHVQDLTAGQTVKVVQQ